MTSETTRAERLPALAAAALTEAQKTAAAEFRELRRTEVFGPFVPLLRSPELLRAANRMGLHLRYRSSLPLRISELVILLVAREWSQPVEWHIHHPIALKAGLDPAVADAVAEGRRPEPMAEDEAAAWDFATELHRSKGVSDPTYARAKAAFGEEGVVELAGLCGYYGLLAMTMNVARTALPPDARPGLPALPA
jgi:4-carboxymuconolactone decarboxylase